MLKNIPTFANVANFIILHMLWRANFLPITIIACDRKWYASLTVFLLKFAEVKLVHERPSLNFGQNFLVKKITHASAKFLVRHVWSAILFPPQTCDLAWANNPELSVCPLPSNDCRVSRVPQKAENELEQSS